MKSITGRIFITIFSGLFLLSAYFSVHSYHVHINTAEENILSKLSSISKTLSVQMDGLMLKMIFEMFPEKDAISSNEQHAYYNEQYKILKRTQELNEINSSIYTLTYDSTNQNFFYGISSSDKPFFRHKYESFPQKLVSAYHEGGTIPAFEDDHGVWLTAFSPIFHKNKVVGVVVVDMPFEQFIAEAKKELFENIAISLTVCLVIGLIIYGQLKKILSADERRKKELMDSYEIIEQKKDELKLKNKAITSSLWYAKRIQSAILPSQKEIKKYLDDSFIYYKPRDIVAGDFYWFEKKGDNIYFAAADCTGHGVPGAMVSMVCSKALNRSVNEFNLSEPNEILDKVSTLVEKTFEKSESEIVDGMDISFCRINLKTKKLCFSGANNPLYQFTGLTNGEAQSANGSLIHNGKMKLIEYKGDKQPIGKYAYQKPFTKQEIDLKSGDAIYLFTDGYVDQFGGKKGKKFMCKSFKRLLLSVQDKKMDQQLCVIDETFKNWKGAEDQVDDICVIGFTVPK